MKKFLLSAFLLSAAVSLQAQNVYTYYFNGNFYEAGGTGPELTTICTGTFVQDSLTDFGTLVRDVYRFDQNCGFQFDDSLTGFIASGSYSIELYFKMDDLTSWKRVIDFKMRSTDWGCYVYYGQLNFYNIASSTGAPFAPSDYSHYVITRDSATKDVIMYGDGNKYIAFNDALDDAVYTASRKLQFFHDDLIVPNEASSGSIGILRIYNYALDSVTVGDLYDNLNNTLGISSVNGTGLEVKMYPNPVANALSLTLPKEGNFSFSVISHTGSVVKDGVISSAQETIDVTGLADGMYMIRLTGDDGSSGHAKFLKQ